ncbi:restriction endonuclease subunit S [Blautia sp.]|uniref:restriction endonuclease subunit S n=1 Tax=Blautia sp. TaxID=1955243 RepID=UPI003AB34E50
MEKCKLGDICEIVSGSTPKTTIEEYWDGDVKWITPAELNENVYIINDSVRKITKLAVEKTGLSSFPEGTVILSTRAPIGKVAIAGCEMYCNQGFKNLICSEKIFNKYLYWFLKGNTMFLNSLGRGATFKEISKAIVSEIEINVPEIEEQHEIVKILEKVNTIIRFRKQELSVLDTLVKARFVEMFGDPVSNPYGYDKVALSDLADIKIGPFGSLLHKEDYIVGGHPLLNPSHIVDGRISPNNKLTISDEKYKELSAYQLKTGDVVMGRRGEMGRCAVVSEEGFLCGTGSILIRTKGEVTADYIQKTISFPSFKKTIEDMAVGQTMPNLNVPIVSSFEIIKPPIEVQDRYYALVEQVDKSKVINQLLQKWNYMCHVTIEKVK